MLITEAMKKWKVNLTTSGQTLAEVKIQRDIFKGDVLSSVQFVIANKCLDY